MIDSRDSKSGAFSCKDFQDKADILTPHKVCLMVLVQQYLKTKRKSHTCERYYPAQSRRRFCMLLLKLIQLPDMRYGDVHSMLASTKYKIDLDHLQEFEKRMAELVILGLESLFDLFDTHTVIEKTLYENSGIGQFGIISLYMRRIAITLDKMSFHEMMALYKSLVGYYEQGIRSLSIISNKEIANTERTDLKISKRKTNRNKWSIKQSELFTYKQGYCLEHNEVKALPPIELHKRTCEILKDNPLFSKAFFLNYLNNLRIQEFYGSMEALHGAFDKNSSQNHNPNNSSGFQYLSLNLAILHFQFNHKKLSKNCIGESKKLAQEMGDKHCLQHSSAWDYVFNDKYISIFEKCIFDEVDLIIVPSASLSIQFMAKIAVLSGVSPSTVAEALFKSDNINGRNSITELVVNCIAERAAIWNLYGKNEMGLIYCQVLLRVSRPWTTIDIEKSEALCQVLSALNLSLNIQAEFQLSNLILHFTSECFPRYPLAQNWMASNLLGLVHRSTCEEKWNNVSTACCQLYIVSKDLSKLQRGCIYTTRGFMILADVVLGDLLYYNLEPLLHIRTMLSLLTSMSSCLHFDSRTFNLFDKASTFSTDKFMESELSYVNVNFCKMLLYTKMPYKALGAIESSENDTFSNGSLHDKASAILLLVKCLINSRKLRVERIEMMDKCMYVINEAIIYFKELKVHTKVKNIYMFLATFYHKMEQYAERNKYSYKFKCYDKSFPSTTDYVLIPF